MSNNEQVDNNNVIEKTVETKKTRKTINSAFIKHQNETFNRLLTILNISLTDKSTHTIDRLFLISKKEEIESLYDDIVLYYNSGVFHTIKGSTTLRYMSICRQLFKFHNVIFKSGYKVNSIDGKLIKKSFYVITPINQVEVTTNEIV